MAQSHKHSPQIPRSGKSHMSIFRKGVGPSSYDIPITTKVCETYRSSIRMPGWHLVEYYRPSKHFTSVGKSFSSKREIEWTPCPLQDLGPLEPNSVSIPLPHPISFDYLQQLPYCTTWANSHKVQGQLVTDEPGLKFSWLRKGKLHHSRGPYIISFQWLSHGRYM